MIAFGVVLVHGSGLKYEEQRNACDELLDVEAYQMDIARHGDEQCMER